MLAAARASPHSGRPMVGMLQPSIAHGARARSQSGERGDGSRHPPLHRMLARDVTACRLAQRPRRNQKGRSACPNTCCAPRARPRRRARRHGRWACGKAECGAAFEVVLTEIGALEPAAHDLHMGGLPVVRGAGERDLLLAHCVTLGGASLEQRQNLNRLDRRARVDDRLSVAPALHEAARRVDHRRIHQVPALDRRAARALDHQRPLRMRHHRQSDPPSSHAGLKP